jgi:hypothetical protein
MDTLEQEARKPIDEMLQQSGWIVQDTTQTNLAAGFLVPANLKLPSRLV